MSADDPLIYHRKWKSNQSQLWWVGAPLLFITGCLPFTVPAILGIAIGILIGNISAGFYITVGGYVLLAVFMQFGGGNWLMQSHDKKQRELALLSIEAGACPRCGAHASENDRNEYGQWVCGSCRALFSKEGKFRPLAK